MAERRLGLADKLARVFPDRRDPTRVVHNLVDMFCARMFAIACPVPSRSPDKVDEVADDIRTRGAIENLPVLRGYTETRHKAKSWDRERTVARLEATMLGLDSYTLNRTECGSG